MMVLTGRHYKLELELLIEDVRQIINDAQVHQNGNIVSFINARIRRELVDPFNESMKDHSYSPDPISKCEVTIKSPYIFSDQEFTLHLNVVISDDYSKKINKEHAFKKWPF